MKPRTNPRATPAIRGLDIVSLVLRTNRIRTRVYDPRQIIFNPLDEKVKSQDEGAAGVKDLGPWITLSRDSSATCRK